MMDSVGCDVGKKGAVGGKKNDARGNGAWTEEGRGTSKRKGISQQWQRGDDETGADTCSRSYNYSKGKALQKRLKGTE